MGILKGSQSNNIYLTMLVVGTASFLSPMNQYAEQAITPSQNYNLNFLDTERTLGLDYNYKLPDYLSENFPNNQQELIEMPIVTKLKIKIKTPVPLKFESVENDDGFII